jgi:hypothetical protein
MSRATSSRSRAKLQIVPIYADRPRADVRDWMQDIVSAVAIVSLIACVASWAVVFG